MGCCCSERRGRPRSIGATVSSPALLGSPSSGLGGVFGTSGNHSTGVGAAPATSGGGTAAALQQQQHSSVPVGRSNRATHDWWGFAKQRRHVRLDNGAGVKEAPLAGHTTLQPQQ